MKRLILILLLIMFIFSGCESVKLDGFSVGVAYLNTDVETTTTNDLGAYGQLTSKKTTKVDSFMPIGLLNFKFE